MKKIYGFILGIFILGLVSALVITQFNITNVIFDIPTEKVAPTPEQITFDCGGKKAQVVDIIEPDLKYDENDLRKAINSVCSKKVSNIMMNGLLYKQNKYGTKSFDEEYLKKDECTKDGNYWYNDNCNDVSKEEQNCIDLGGFWYDSYCNIEPKKS